MSKINIFGSRFAPASAGTTANFALACQQNAGASEAVVQRTFRSAGVLSNLYTNIVANAASTDTTVAVRINGANGNQVVTISGGATGEFEDTDSDTISAGDEINFQAIIGATSTVTIGNLSVLFAATTNTVAQLNTTNSGTLSTASTTTYHTMGGVSAGGTATETNAQHKIKSAGTLKNLLFNVSTNGRGTATTGRVRKNASNGNGVVSCTASTTGIFEDTSNTDTVAVDDLINFSITTGTGTGNFVAFLMSVEFETTDTSWPIVSSHDVSGAHAASVTRYVQLCGNAGGQTAEGDAQQDANVDFTWSKLAAYVTANTITATSSIKSRINGADGAQALSIGSSGTGYFEDASNTDAVAAADEINYQLITGGSGTAITISKFASRGQITAAPTSITPPAGSQALTGLAGRMDFGIFVPTQVR